MNVPRLILCDASQHFQIYFAILASLCNTSVHLKKKIAFVSSQLNFGTMNLASSWRNITFTHKASSMCLKSWYVLVPDIFCDAFCNQTNSPYSPFRSVRKEIRGLEFCSSSCPSSKIRILKNTFQEYSIIKRIDHGKILI